MTPDEIDAFLAEPRVAVIATVDDDGRPRTAPIWFLWDDGAAVLFTARSTRKWANLQRHAYASLCVDHREPPYAQVVIEGRVEEATGRSLYDDVRRMALAYYGPAEGERFAEGYRDRPDVALFRIVPDRIVARRS